MEFKGTRGKWKVSTSNEEEVLISGTTSIIDICSVHRYGDKKEEDANAILISKSPEMLKLLIEIIGDKYNSIDIDSVNKAEKLINEIINFK